MKPGSGYRAFQLVSSIVVCQLAGLIGTLFTVPAIDTWYTGLKKPVFNPPNWLFAPVWIMLYFLIGVSAFLVWREGLSKRETRTAMLLFLVQLVLNAAWTPIFFGLRLPKAAFVLIIAMWLAILATILSFRKISAVAAILMLPYIIWVGFAAVLNAAIAILN